MDAKTARSAWEQNKTVDVEKLHDLVGRLENALDQANQKIEELTKKLDALTKTTKLDKPYSVSAHEQREQNAAAGKPKKRKPNKNRDIKLGRKTNPARGRNELEHS